MPFGFRRPSWRRSFAAMGLSPDSSECAKYKIVERLRAFFASKIWADD